MIFVVVYFDDCYVIGSDLNLKLFISNIQKEFQIKIQENPTDYLSCDICLNMEKGFGWIGQPHLIKRSEKSFGSLVSQSNIRYATPGTPSQTIVSPQTEEEQLDPERQMKYQLAVGTLLQFVKHSCPDIANPVHELSKCMDKPTEAGYKEMLRVVKFVLDTRNFGLFLRPTSLDQDASWSLAVYSDSNWAGDSENRISGFIIFLLGCPVVWKSKQQQSVTQSSSEAEYVALLEAAKELKFIAQTLESIRIKVKYLTTVFVDNVGAIFILENVTATKQT
jgi:hypothetical protein